MTYLPDSADRNGRRPCSNASCIPDSTHIWRWPQASVEFLTRVWFLQYFQEVLVEIVVIAVIFIVILARSGTKGLREKVKEEEYGEGVMRIHPGLLTGTG